MQNSQNKKVLQIGLFLLIAIVVLGIGYASISAINLIINGNATASVNQNNFTVHFIEAKNIAGTTGVGGTSIIDSDDTKASFNVTGLTKVGDYAEAKYKVKNDSNGIGAEITLELTNSNSEYFKVTETIDDDKLQAGEETYATVKVEMIKTPINDDVTTTVTAKLIASPLENANATGGGSTSKSSDDPVSFATDSWATIKTAVQNNNTSLYNIGDTKTVKINGTDYTLRIANKSTPSECNNENYSQTACGFVVEFADIVEERGINGNNSSTNIGGWPGSELYTYLQGTFYDSLPSDLKSSIKFTKVVSGYGCISEWNGTTCGNPDNNGNDFTSIDKMFLLSGVEIYGEDPADTSSVATRQLDYYTDIVAESEECSYYSGCTRTVYPIARKRYNGTITSYWLRSPFLYYKYSFRYIDDSGSLNGYYPVNTAGVAPAFRIG